MNTTTAARGLGITMSAVALLLVGCGSDSSAPSSPSAEASSSSTKSSKTTPSQSPSATASADGDSPSLEDYFRDRGLTRTFARNGDPGAPQLNLPIPEGWQEVTSEDVPEEAWGAMVYGGGNEVGPDAPNIIVALSRLEGEVDQQELLDVTVNGVANIDGFEAMGPPEPASLGGYEARHVAGTITDEAGVQNFGANAVVIPADGAVYLLQLTATGREDQGDLLSGALDVIDEQTTITP